MLLRTTDTARESLWLVHGADGEHCSLYLLKSDERDEERRASLYGWMEDTRLETDFTLCLTNMPKDYVQF